MKGRVNALARAAGHAFSKQNCAEITLITGKGVAGDAHAGAQVKHRSRIAVDPTQPNLRQVHLLSVELLALYAQAGFVIAPGDLGENVTTEGIDLHALPRGARLTIGEAVLEVTGLRNPCAQIDAFAPGLLAHVLRRDSAGAIQRRAGIMAIVLSGGSITTGDTIRVTLPAPPHLPLERV